MNISVIGCGFVGSTVADFLETHMIKVVRIDPAKHSNTLDDAKTVDAHIICVPTPEDKDGKCDDSIIKTVINQLDTNKPILFRCSFSWYCDGKKDEPEYDSHAWFLAQDYARIVLSGKIVLDVTEGATHYHATYVRPSWAKTKKRTTRIDRHIFYRWER